MSSRLESALTSLSQVFPVEGELALVAAGAKAHHVDLEPGDLFDGMKETSHEKHVGAYNAHSPATSNISRDEGWLTQARSLTVICEDYRQSAQAVAELRLDPVGHKDAVLAIAGGPTQPREGRDGIRHATLVEFIVAFHQVNPGAVIRLIAHDQKCGGHAHFIGTAAQALESRGIAAEDAIMINDLKLMAQDLVAAGVNEAKLKLLLAQVNADNSYKGLKKVQL